MSGDSKDESQRGRFPHEGSGLRCGSTALGRTA